MQQRIGKLLSGAKRYRRWVGIAVLIATLVLVIRFFFVHPDYIRQLAHVPPLVIIGVILLNIPAMAALAWAYDAMLGLCGTRIPLKENLLLTAYSSLANFFGPLESGPGLRLVYLKARHNIRIRDYMLATLLYLAFFAGLSALFLLIGVRPWWQTFGAVIAVCVFSAAVIYIFLWRGKKKNTSQNRQFHLHALPLASLLIATFLQLCFIASYFYVELHAVDPHIHIGQAISYAGAANFSLFVSLTPDAVGIREAFLLFSQHIHHVPTADIVNANIIDRGSYLLYLLLLFGVTLSVHARDRLHLRGRRNVTPSIEP